MPPFAPPAQFGPPHAQISTPTTLAGRAPLAQPALTMPPSTASRKLTLVAFGSMPKPKDVSRSPPMPPSAEVFVSVTATESRLELKPEIVIDPKPVNRD